MSFLSLKSNLSMEDSEEYTQPSEMQKNTMIYHHHSSIIWDLAIGFLITTFKGSEDSRIYMKLLKLFKYTSMLLDSYQSIWNRNSLPLMCTTFVKLYRRIFVNPTSTYKNYCVWQAPNLFQVFTQITHSIKLHWLRDCLTLAQDGVGHGEEILLSVTNCYYYIPIFIGISLYNSPQLKDMEWFQIC